MKCAVLVLIFSVAACSGGGGGGARPASSTTVNEISALGDSVTMGFGATTNYPTLIGETLGYAVQNLGVKGMTAVLAVKQEAPLISPSCSLGTVNLGIDDGYAIANGTETVAQYLDAMHQIIAAMKSRCRKVIASTVIINPNQSYERLVNPIILSLGIPVVDLTKDPRMRDVLHYFNFDEIHPNDAGQAAIAQDFEALLL